MKKKIKKPVKATTILVLVICIILSVTAILLRIIQKPGNTSTTDTDIAETSITEEESEFDSQQSDDDVPNSDGGEEIIPSGKITDDEDKEPETVDSQLWNDPEQDGNTATKKIGNITVEYLTDDAIAGSGTAAGASVEAITFHDGNEADLKGYMFAVNSLVEDGTLESIEDAKACVSEYIPAGSGISSEWEELDGFFIRRAYGYDRESNGAFLFLTIVPRSKSVDQYMYSAVLVMDANGIAIKESSYDSLAGALKDYIPDSELIEYDYEELCSRLSVILHDKNATGDTMGGIQELRDASSEYYKSVYGVDSEYEYNQLSEEEKADRYWKYSDPIGYALNHEEDAVEPEEESTGDD